MLSLVFAYRDNAENHAWRHLRVDLMPSIEKESEDQICNRFENETV